MQENELFDIFPEFSKVVKEFFGQMVHRLHPPYPPGKTCPYAYVNTVTHMTGRKMHAL